MWLLDLVLWGLLWGCLLAGLLIAFDWYLESKRGRR